MTERNMRLADNANDFSDKIESLFFQVDKKRMYWEEEQSFMGEPKLHLCHPQFFAIVDVERRYVFAPVTQNYLLISNKEAYNFGIEIGMMLFHIDGKDDLNCIHAKLSSNRAVCQIDLCRKIDYAQPHINDDWCSFMRITNSYNKTKKLGYVVGFYNVKYGYGFLDNAIAISADTAHYK